MPCFLCRLILLELLHFLGGVCYNFLVKRFPRSNLGAFLRDAKHKGLNADCFMEERQWMEDHVKNLKMKCSYDFRMI